MRLPQRQSAVRLSWLSCLWALYACGVGSPGSHRDTQPDVPRYNGADGREVETLVVQRVITAGTPLTVTCVVRSGGTLVRGEGVKIHVTPTATVQIAGDSGTFKANVSGMYHVACATADDLAVDNKGVAIEVLAGAAVSVDTELEVAQAAAGFPVRVRCPVRDALGNTTSQKATGLLVPTGVELGADLLGDFVVRGGPAGTWPIACKFGEQTDDTPEQLRITAGIPGQTQTAVNKTQATPRETVSVSCTAQDDYGNPLTGVATSFYVLDKDLQQDPGVTLLTGGFSVTRAGTYYVFCNAPGYYAVDESPVVITITAGLPHHWVVDLPNQDCLWQDRPLPLAYAVYDVWNNLIVDAPIVVTTHPAGVVQQDANGGYRIVSQGSYDLFVSVAPPHHPTAQSLQAVLWDVVVDSTPPTVNITSPKRADMLLNGTLADSTVNITGTISDSGSALDSFFLNGVARTVTAGAQSMSISGSMSARWGANVLTAVVVDECGNRNTVAQSFLRSPSYFSAASYSSTGARASQGVMAHLNQVVIDDGNRNDVDDLATIGQRVLQDIDFNAEIPAGTLLTGPYALACGGFCPSSEGYAFMRHPTASRKILWDGPHVTSIQAVNGGFSFDIYIGNFTFPYRLLAGLCGFYTICQTMEVQFDGNVSADWVQATGTLGVSTDATGRPRVTVASMNVNSQDMTFRVDCASWAQWFCDGVTDFASSVAEGFVEDALADAVAEQIPPLAEEFLRGFALDTGFQIPAPLNTYVNIASGFDYVRFCGPNAGIPGATCSSTSRWGDLGLYTQVFPSSRGSGIGSGARGAIRKDGALPAFSATSYAFGMGLKDDLVNQLLWAVWYSGALEFNTSDLRALAPGVDWSALTLSLSAKSPPVLMPGRNGHEIEVALGDVYMQASVDVLSLLGQPSDGSSAVEVGLYASILMGGSLDLDPITNELLIAIDPHPQVWVQVVSIDDPGYQSVVSDLLNRSLTLIAPELLSTVLASFPIPSFNLSAIPGLPDATWELANGSVSRNGDYYRLTGNLR